MEQVLQQGGIVLPDNSGTPKFAGIALVLDGKAFTLPPCSLGTLKRYAKRIAGLSTGAAEAMSEEAVDTILGVVTEALQRNYPGMKAEAVAECIGVDAMQEVFQDAMDVSGLRRKRHEADKAAGEGGNLGESTGTASPPTS